MLLMLTIGPVPAGATGNAVVGAAAPDFALPAVQGGNGRLSEHRGKVVVITFWSSRCSSCVTQLAELNALQERYGPAGLITLAVSVDSDVARARTFAREMAVPKGFIVPMLLDADLVVGRNYGVERLPTTVLIDRAGRMRAVLHDYHRTDNSYISQLRALLDDSGLAHRIFLDSGWH